MSDKVDEMIAAGEQLRYAGEGPFPWGGCFTLIVAIAIAALILSVAGVGG